MSTDTSTTQSNQEDIEQVSAKTLTDLLKQEKQLDLLLKTRAVNSIGRNLDWEDSMVEGTEPGGKRDDEMIVFGDYNVNKDPENQSEVLKAAAGIGKTAAVASGVSPWVAIAAAGLMAIGGWGLARFSGGDSKPVVDTDTDSFFDMEFTEPKTDVK